MYIVIVFILYLDFDKMYVYIYVNEVLGEFGVYIFVDNFCFSVDCLDMCLLINGLRYRCVCFEDKYLESNNRIC